MIHELTEAKFELQFDWLWHKLCRTCVDGYIKDGNKCRVRRIGSGFSLEFNQ